MFVVTRSKTACGLRFRTGSQYWLLERGKVGDQRRCLSWRGINSHMGHFFAPRATGVACWLQDMDKTLVDMDVCCDLVENSTWVMFLCGETILLTRGINLEIGTDVCRDTAEKCMWVTFSR